MAAPKKPDPRTATLSIRVTKAEKAAIGKNAKAAGLLTGEFLRRSALGEVFVSAPRPVVPVIAGTPVDEPIPGRVAEARMPDPESRQAFIDRRTLQLQGGQGATKAVARMKAAQEWEER